MQVRLNYKWLKSYLIQENFIGKEKDWAVMIHKI